MTWNQAPVECLFPVCRTRNILKVNQEEIPEIYGTEGIIRRIITGIWPLFLRSYGASLYRVNSEFIASKYQVYTE
jgi:hypothetical protein